MEHEHWPVTDDFAYWFFDLQGTWTWNMEHEHRPMTDNFASWIFDLQGTWNIEHGT